MNSSDYTEPASGRASKPMPAIKTTEKNPETGACTYWLAGCDPITGIVCSTGPNISSQGAVESLLFAASMGGDMIEGALEEREDKPSCGVPSEIVDQLCASAKRQAYYECHIAAMEAAIQIRSQDAHAVANAVKALGEDYDGSMVQE